MSVDHAAQCVRAKVAKRAATVNAAALFAGRA
jgi:hypothetical protein